MPTIETRPAAPRRRRHTVRYTYTELVELLKREHPEAQGHDTWLLGLEHPIGLKHGEDRGVTMGWDVQEPTDER